MNLALKPVFRRITQQINTHRLKILLLYLPCSYSLHSSLNSPPFSASENSKPLQNKYVFTLNQWAKSLNLLNQSTINKQNAPSTLYRQSSA